MGLDAAYTKLYDQYLRTTSKERVRGYQETLDLLFRAAWMKETARPDRQHEWTEADPWIGQDDVTALLLVLEFRGGSVMISTQHGRPYWFVRTPNGEGYTDLHFAPHFYHGQFDREGVRTFQMMGSPWLPGPLPRDQALALIEADTDLKHRFHLLRDRIGAYMEQTVRARAS